ncbi:MAG: hypothetical protein MI923_16155 [Phycisphaerales bacterium]|nr:hypothetical protein [Phycisphaerales bacterium]
MDDVPFDLQQLRVLLYNKNDPAWGEKLSGDITKAIDETLASPVEAVPSIFRKTVPSQAPEQDAISARLDELESLVRRINTQVAQPSKGEDHVPHRLAQTILKLVEATGLEDQVVIHIGFNHPEAASFSPGETGVYCIFRNDTCIFIGGGDIRKGLLMAMNMASITVKSPNNIYIVKTAHAEFLKQHLVSFFDPVVTP